MRPSAVGTGSTIPRRRRSSTAMRWRCWLLP